MGGGGGGAGVREEFTFCPGKLVRVYSLMEEVPNSKKRKTEVR